MLKHKESCIRCSSLKLVKNGRDNKGRQRYKCQECSKTFTLASSKNPEIRRTKRLASHLLILGYPLEAVAEKLNITVKEASSWERKYLPKLDDLKGAGKLIDIHYAHNSLSALDKGKRPERINKNKTVKPQPKKSTRKKY